MAITRADTLTTAKRKFEYYSDFVTSFNKTPIGNQLGKVSNEESVNQSLRNLIKTNYGERFFQPGLGSNIYASLFDPNTEILRNKLEFYIENTIKNNERRVNLIKVEVLTSESLINGRYANVDSNTVEIIITYSLINSVAPTVLTVILKRIR